MKTVTFKSKLKNFFRYLSHLYLYDSSQSFVKTEMESAKVLIAFLLFQNKNDEEIIEILYKRFEPYRHKLGFVNSYIHLKQLINSTVRQRVSSYTYQYLSELPTNYRLFVLYSLIEIASFDKLYSIKEDSFIDNVREKLKIPKATLTSIIDIYSKRGLKEEQKLINEAQRKKATKSFSEIFIPYNAYKILGISPSVTKAHLKKVYRTLVKKYHPDKFYGQREAIIQKAEDKFQEITEAYEIILKFKKY